MSFVSVPGTGPSVTVVGGGGPALAVNPVCSVCGQAVWCGGPNCPNNPLSGSAQDLSLYCGEFISLAFPTVLSQANEFYATPSSEVGCIGTIMCWPDVTEALAKEGIKMQAIYSGSILKVDPWVTSNYQGLSTRLLRAQIIGRAKNMPGLREIVGISHLLGDAEINNGQCVIGPEHDVFWFQITMHNTEVVNRFQGQRDLLH